MNNFSLPSNYNQVGVYSKQGNFVENLAYEHIKLHICLIEIEDSI